MNKKIVMVIILLGLLVMPIVSANELDNYRDQNIHIGVMAGMLIFVSWLMYLYITNDKFILTGILAGILLILMAAMMFNNLYYDVCRADVETASFYCGVQSFEIPYIYKWALQVLFFIVGFGFILDAMLTQGEKKQYKTNYVDNRLTK